MVKPYKVSLHVQESTRLGASQWLSWPQDRGLGCDIGCSDPFEYVLSNSLEAPSNDVDLALGAKLCTYVQLLEASPPFFTKAHLHYISLEVPTTKLFPSVEQPPEVELKQLLPYLKYAFLGKKDTLSVMI